MALQIFVSNIQEIIYWRGVFRLLGIRSCQPLLERMGVSKEVADQPEGLRRAAIHFWELFVTVDLRDLGGSVISSNHAYRFWRVLSSSLDASELDTWLWIGYEQAQKLGMPVEDVQLPPLGEN